MRKLILISMLASLVSCAHMPQDNTGRAPSHYYPEDYAARLPQTYNTNGKKMVLVDPKAHAWGAYDSDGKLVRGGIATAGGVQCPPEDADEPSCKTGVGTFKITSLGDDGCYSKKYPRPNGGGLMPYCMFFNNGQALHGSPDNIVIEDNVSHGCVRMRIPDAEWMRYNFAQVGTKVVVLPYN
jgi:L,D-transpeptidase ErfK/SrfK